MEAQAELSTVLEQMARVIESAMPALGLDDDRFLEHASGAVRTLRHSGSDLSTVRSHLASFSLRVSCAAEDQSGVRSSLLQLLKLVFQNIGELCVEDRWLRGQIDALISAASPPLSLRRLDDMESRLKEVIFKQREARSRASVAQAQMQQLLATFVDRLSIMSESSSAYHGKIEGCARQIENANSLEELGPVLQEAIVATRAIAKETGDARDELQEMRAKTEEAEREISKLHMELDRVSAQARHDALTGTLNRRGLDEALNREITTCTRKGSELCVALLDLDNFKKDQRHVGPRGRRRRSCALGRRGTANHSTARFACTLRWGGVRHCSARHRSRGRHHDLEALAA